MGLDVDKNKKYPWIEFHEFDFMFRCKECGGSMDQDGWPLRNDDFYKDCPDLVAAAKKFTEEHKHCSLDHCLSELFAVELPKQECPVCSGKNGLHAPGCVWKIAKETFLKKKQK